MALATCLDITYPKQGIANDLVSLRSVTFDDGTSFAPPEPLLPVTSTPRSTPTP